MSQNGFETWRSHFCFRNATSICNFSDEIYIGCPKGMFIFNKNSKEIEVITKVEGLSQTNISGLAFHNSSKSLIISYTDGTIDIKVGNKIFTLTQIKRSSVGISKKINHLNIIQNYVYVSCDFGLVIIDIIKKEVIDSYINLGTGNSNLAILGSEVFKDTLYLATREGIIFASNAFNVNKKDVSNWKKKNSALFSAILIKKNANKMYAIDESKNVYLYKNNTWNLQPNISLNGTVHNLKSFNNILYIVCNNQLLEIDSTETISSKTFNSDLRDIIVDENKEVWFADFEQGLLKPNSVGIYPDGPINSYAFSLSYFDGNSWILPGGFDNIFTGLSRIGKIHRWDNSHWSYLDTQNSDITSIIKSENDLLYIATIANGVIVSDKNGGIKEYINNSTEGSTLTNSVGDFYYNRITDLAIDKSGKLWILAWAANNLNFPSLHVRYPNKTFKGFLFGNNTQSAVPRKILIDDYDNKWIITGNTNQNGLFVFNENNKTQNSRQFTSDKGAGNLADNLVMCMAKDFSGSIWVGTGKGVSVFLNPISALENRNFDSSKPIYNSKPFLEGQFINCMDIDAGGQKWFGTPNGLFLFSNDVSKQIYEFNEQNSPLPSSNILDVKVNQRTGEVFILTSEGVVSFRGESIDKTQIDAQILTSYPNPVNENYEGLITIVGAPNNGRIKITDINGRLIKDLKGLGSSVSWDQKDNYGKTVQGGLYILIMISDSGEETIGGKLAIQR